MLMCYFSLGIFHFYSSIFVYLLFVCLGLFHCCYTCYAMVNKDYQSVPKTKYEKNGFISPIWNSQPQTVLISDSV